MDETISIYKYMGPDISSRFLAEAEKCTIKLSYLKDYNDPYEFFLTIDYNKKPELLAYYNEIISMVVQQPVTCFSKTPSSTPMWAHYASNSQGFVAEINEKAFEVWLETQEASPHFGDINYQDTPSDDVEFLLHTAYETCKYRHVGFLWSEVRRAAYFTKQSCWNYEHERRLLTSENVARKINENLSLLYFPSNLVTAIIAGAQASNETKARLMEVAQSIGCNYLEMRIGKSSTNPFFIDNSNNTYTFYQGKITQHLACCEQCREPIINQHSSLCSWCQINEAHKDDAASRNAFRVLHYCGLLDTYMERFMGVGSSVEK